MPHKFTRISKKQKEHLLKCFAADLTATQTALITGLNRNTVNDWYISLRRAIMSYRKENPTPKPSIKDSQALSVFQSGRFSKFNGISAKKLPLYIEESTFRYENKGKVLPILTRIVRESGF